MLASDALLLLLARLNLQIGLTSVAFLEQKVNGFLDIVVAVHPNENIPGKLWPSNASVAFLESAASLLKLYGANQTERLTKMLTQFLDIPETCSLFIHFFLFHTISLI